MRKQHGDIGRNVRFRNGLAALGTLGLVCLTGIPTLVEAAPSSLPTGGYSDMGPEIIGTPADPPAAGVREALAPGSIGPVVLSNLDLVYTEVDFKTNHLYPLMLTRTYNHYNVDGDGAVSGLFGPYWSSNFDVHLRFALPASPTVYCDAQPGQAPSHQCIALTTPVSSVGVVMADGSSVTYKQKGSTNNYVSSSPDATDSVTRNSDGSWTLQNINGAVENFNPYGFITSTADPTGIGWTFSYSNNCLQTATHSNGQSITFSWTGGQLTSVTDTAGSVYQYSYRGNGMLAGVAYPGPGQHSRTYYYDAGTPTDLTSVAVDNVTYKTFAYKYGGGPVKQTSLGDGTETLTFADSGATTTVTNASGGQTQYTYKTYNGQAQLTGVVQTDATSGVTVSASNTYDSDGHLSQSTDFMGYSANYTYSANGLLLDKVTGINGSNTSQQRETKYTWDTTRNRISEVDQLDSNGAPLSSAVYSYYADNTPQVNRIQSIAVTNLSANGILNQVQTTNFSYAIGSNGIPTKIVISGPLAGRSGYSETHYTSKGTLSTIVDATGNATSNTGANALGYPATVTDPNGYATSFTYDKQGRVLTTSRTLDGVSATTTYQYNGLGEVADIMYADGGEYSYTYNQAGRLVSKTNNIQQSQDSINGGYLTTSAQDSYGYDSLGDLNSVASQTLTSGMSCPKPDSCLEVDNASTYYSHNWSYDSLGRLLTDSGSNGQSLSYKYNGNSLVSSITDSQGGTTHYAYNLHGQVRLVTDAAGNQTTYTYDALGGVSTVQDARGNITDYYRDGLGHVVTVSSPDSGVTTYQYDAQGRLAQMQRADGSITSLYYDNLNRPLSIVAGTQTEGFSYDSCSYGVGRLCGITDASGSTSYGYRQNGQVNAQTSVINGSTYNASWTYDNRDRVASITYPGGNTVSYQYDGQSNPTQVKANVGGTNTTIAAGMTYIGFGLGPLQHMTHGDGIADNMTYDTDLRLQTIQSGGGSKSVQWLSYNYDNNNNIGAITNNLNGSLTQTFNYDQLYRLTTVTAGVGNQSITPDTVGNRNSAAWGGATDTFNNDPLSNRISSISGNRARTFTYDSLGNTHKVTGWGGNKTYNYDSFNRLGSVVTGSGTTAYIYNALNQRVRKAGPGGNYNYLYGPDGTLLAETSAGGTAMSYRQYFWLNGKLLALSQSGTVYHVRNDHLGRPDVVTDGSGSIVWQASNTAFDRTVTTSSLTGGLNIGFPGQYYDSESGLWYNRARYYDSTLGRYISSDPIGLAGGIDAYSYVLGNPVGLIDPTGYSSAGIIGTIFAAGSAVAGALPLYNQPVAFEISFALEDGLALSLVAISGPALGTFVIVTAVVGAGYLIYDLSHPESSEASHSETTPHAPGSVGSGGGSVDGSDGSIVALAGPGGLFSGAGGGGGSIVVGYPCEGNKCGAPSTPKSK